MKTQLNCDDKLLTESELLTKLPVSRRTLFTLRREGRVPFIRVKRKLLYDWETVRGALLANERSAR